jgi:dienelactone hydrolase
MLTSGMNVWWSRPSGDGPKPLVVILHERYGPVQHNFDLLNRVAESGFVGAMPDLFHRYEGDRRPIEEGQARAELPDDTCSADINELIDHMRQQNFVDGERIGVVGFCQSGRAPLMMASRRTDLRGIGVFYGGIYHIRLFGGAPHGWLNDTVPDRYRPEQASAAWQTLESFFNSVFANEPSSERVSFKFESDIPPEKVQVGDGV